MLMLKIAAVVLTFILDFTVMVLAGWLASQKNDMWIVSIVLVFITITVTVYVCKALFYQKKEEDVP